MRRTRARRVLLSLPAYRGDVLLVDVLLIVLLVISVVVGVRRGFLASLGLFAGLAAGAVAAYWLMPLVGRWVPAAAWRTLAVAATGLFPLLLEIGRASWRERVG